MSSTIYTKLDELTLVFLEAIYCNGSLKSFNLFKFPEFDGDETEAEKLAKFTAAENASQKFGLRLLTRKTGETNWREKAEIIMVNRGRKDYFDLLNPYMSQQPLRLLEQNDEIAIQLVDYGYGLLKTDDFLELEFAIRIESEKKNEEIESLKQQVATLQLAIDGKLTNIAPNYFLGREVNSGVIQQIPFSRFAKPADIDTAIFNLMGAAPGALDTLDELAQALADDANFATTVTNQLALKAPSANPVFTGTVGGITADMVGLGNVNNTSDANKPISTATQNALNLKANIVQPIDYIFKAGASTFQAIPSDVWTKVILNSVIIDSNNQYNSTNSRLIATSAQTWQINLYITLRLTVNSRILLSVMKNGTEIKGVSRLLDTIANTGDFGISLNLLDFPLNVSDYLEVFCYASPSVSVYGDLNFITSFWAGKRIK